MRIEDWIEKKLVLKNVVFYKFCNNSLTLVQKKENSKEYNFETGDYVIIQTILEKEGSENLILKEILYHGPAVKKPLYDYESNLNKDVQRNSKFFWLRKKQNRQNLELLGKILKYTAEYFNKEKYLQVYTPKLLKTSGIESGAEVFKVISPNTEDYTLAQSPQLFKQYFINSGFNKIFQIGPIFRAQKFKTNRHFYEALCLDVEQRVLNLETITEVLRSYLTYLIEKLEKKHTYTEIDYKDACKLLNLEYGTDFNTVDEKKICNLLDKDWVLVKKFPKFLRPFYTNGDNSFDLLNKTIGEVSSGAIRSTDYEYLKQHCDDNDYVESFSIGAPLTGGFGLGLERLALAFNQQETDSLKDYRI